MSMNVTCGACSAKFQIDDGKLPAGKVFIKCPKCSARIEVSKPGNAPAAGVAAPPPAPAAVEMNPFDAPEDPKPPAAKPAAAPLTSSAPRAFAIPAPHVAATSESNADLSRHVLGLLNDLLKKGVRPESLTAESLDETVKRALVCEDEEMFSTILRDQLTLMGYSVDIAATTADSLLKVKTGGYELVTIDFRFPDNPEGGYEILRALSAGGSTARRKIYAVFLSADFKTMDTGSAFFHGANLTINKKEVKRAAALIQEGMLEYRRYYRVFHSVQNELMET